MRVSFQLKLRNNARAQTCRLAAHARCVAGLFLQISTNIRMPSLVTDESRTERVMLCNLKFLMNHIYLHVYNIIHA